MKIVGDICPTNTAPIIEKSEHGLNLDVCKWGYPLLQGKKLVINTRTESVMDKPSFLNGILYYHILIPASGFYEWSRLKVHFSDMMQHYCIWLASVFGLRMNDDL